MSGGEGPCMLTLERELKGVGVGAGRCCHVQPTAATCGVYRYSRTRSAAVMCKLCFAHKYALIHTSIRTFVVSLTSFGRFHTCRRHLPSSLWLVCKELELLEPFLTVWSVNLNYDKTFFWVVHAMLFCDWWIVVSLMINADKPWPKWKLYDLWFECKSFVSAAYLGISRVF